jgi:hypothetical protein
MVNFTLLTVLNIINSGLYLTLKIYHLVNFFAIASILLLKLK